MRYMPSRVSFIFFCLTGLLGIFIQARAVSLPITWRWSNPLPHGNNVIDMAFSTNFWIQVAERGQVYTSTDLKAWIPENSHTTNSLRSVTFFKNQIIITGENGLIVSGESADSLTPQSLQTSDWLESVTASPDLLVAVGDNAAIYTSSTGTNWQRQTVSFTDWLRSVAYGTPAGVGVFVAVGESGAIATSLNGATWQKRTAPTTEDFNKVIWADGVFLAAGTGGKVYSSATGAQWQAVNTGATNTLNTIATNGTARVVAGESEVRLFDGRSWSNELSSAKPSPPPAWTYLSSEFDGTSYVLAGRTGMLVEGFKTNTTSSPTFWLPFFDSPRSWLWDVKRFSNVHIAAGDQATILTSLDGIVWEQELVPDAATNAIFLGIGGRTNFAVAVGNGGTIITSLEDFTDVVSTNASGGLITNRVSTLGIQWQPVLPRPTTVDLQGVATFGGQLVVSGGDGTILTSSNGSSWTKRSTPTHAFLSSVESFPGGLVACGASGALVTSTDGATWTPRSTGTTNWIYRVRYLGGKLVAVGQNGTIRTSTDGTTWTPQNSGTTRWLNDVCFADNTYFAIGTQGAVLMSTDTVTWTDVGTVTQKSLYGAAEYNGQLVMVGIEGVIIRSQIVPVQTPVTIVDYPKSPQQHLFLFGGETDQRFRLDSSTNLIDWTLGPDLEFFGNSDTFLYLDTKGTNSLPNQFFRTVLRP